MHLLYCRHYMQKVYIYIYSINIVNRVTPTMQQMHVLRLNVIL